MRKLFVMMFVCLMAMSSLSGCSSNNSENETSYNKDEVIKTWIMTSEVDEMTNTENFWASLKSDNFFRFDFPYEGKTYATLVIRNVKKYGGNDVYIKIDRGQIYSYDDRLLAKFDNGSPISYTYSETTTNNSEVVFIDKANDFINRCRQAKEIKIELPIFDEGEKVYTFKVDSVLVWNHK